MKVLSAAAPKILVVDDEPLVLEVVTAILRNAKYDVLAAVNVNIALQLASDADHISLAVVNHSVSSAPGRDIVEMILRLHPTMKVLRFSGHFEKDLRSKGKILPESFFLQKPFTTQQLIEKVAAIIGPE